MPNLRAVSITLRMPTRSALLLWLFATPALAQGPLIKPEDPLVIKELYTKYEYRIPMRDGKHLFTAVYVPKNATWKFPIMLMRTPYSVRPYGVDVASGVESSPARKDPAKVRRFVEAVRQASVEA